MRQIHPKAVKYKNKAIAYITIPLCRLLFQKSNVYSVQVGKLTILDKRFLICTMSHNRRLKTTEQTCTLLYTKSHALI